ncbi:CinA family protein [Acinetobacter sp. V102_4]|uniref:CinA family protein n=1 Tax=Acinetobacter sp. V102_4 TaxID=3072984 RepID=UPI00287E699B|nr:CinA family protein [Acinetobacter sp. V102_4]MDS7930547.1 CinA family protein [Acinetobacter sp. V102_4]
MLQHCCQILETRQLKIAFIESASSGYLTSQFSIHKNSGADILLGGLVSYDPSIKVSILNIDPKLIETYTAESPQVTEEMCKLGQTLFPQADLIVSCTGLLKSGGSETAEKPVGTFFMCIYYQDHIYHYHYFLSGHPEQKLKTLTQKISDALIALLTSTTQTASP